MSARNWFEIRCNGNSSVFSDDDSDGDWVKSDEPATCNVGGKIVKLPTEETEVFQRKQASPSASPVSDGSGGGEEAGCSGKETAPPSASPVSDSSGGGEEAGAPAQVKPRIFSGPRPRKRKDREETKRKRETPGTRLYEADKDSLRKWEAGKAADRLAKERIRYGFCGNERAVTRSMVAGSEIPGHQKGCPLE